MAVTGSLSWEKVHNECLQVSNASIVCSDGVIHTHKLVLVNVSQLLGTIMRDIPAGDDVTIYLKDFPRHIVEQVLMECSQNSESSHEELVFLLGLNRKTYQKYLVKKENNVINQQEKTLVKTEVSYQEDLDEEKYNAAEPEVDLVEYDNKVTVEKIRKQDNMNQGTSFLGIGDQEVLEDNFDKETIEKIREFQNELIENPVTPKEIKLNKMIDKKIRYEKAVAAVKSGQIKSCRLAGKLYGVCHQTVGEFITKGTSFQGSGQVPKKFSKAEEKVIIERIKNLVEGGRDLTIKLIGEVIAEEAEVIQINQPERSETVQSVLKKGFVYNFAKRNNLNQLCDTEAKKDRDERRQYECEVCYKKFTKKSACVSHMKTLHGFLFSVS